MRPAGRDYPSLTLRVCVFISDKVSAVELALEGCEQLHPATAPAADALEDTSLPVYLRLNNEPLSA